jgi:MOSC domain-containing protein YiiM
MKIISLNVGLPRLVEYNGEPVATGILKEPVPGSVMLRTLNLDGDRQADLSVHGGVSKAVYGYPAEHYDFWKRELPEMELPYGCSARTLRPKACLKTNSTSAIAFASVKLS